ncbi:MAG: hypothetical protein WCI51_05810 [Lentisphaerota bacterium]
MAHGYYKSRILGFNPTAQFSVMNFACTHNAIYKFQNSAGDGSIPMNLDVYADNNSPLSLAITKICILSSLPVLVASLVHAATKKSEITIHRKYFSARNMKKRLA